MGSQQNYGQAHVQSSAQPQPTYAQPEYSQAYVSEPQAYPTRHTYAPEPQAYSAPETPTYVAGPTYQAPQNLQYSQQTSPTYPDVSSHNYDAAPTHYQQNYLPSQPTYQPVQPTHRPVQPVYHHPVANQHAHPNTPAHPVNQETSQASTASNGE